MLGSQLQYSCRVILSPPHEKENIVFYRVRISISISIHKA